MLNKITLTGVALIVGWGAAVLAQATAFAAERDPTRPGAMSGALSNNSVMDTAGLTLQAIFFTSDNRQAVINNQIVTEGDILAGNLIEQINTNTVILRSRSASKPVVAELRLSLPSSVKRSIVEEF